MDPMTHSTEWGMRSMQDDPTSDSWGGQGVFDVYYEVNRNRAGRNEVFRLVRRRMGMILRSSKFGRKSFLSRAHSSAGALR
jgi:hypothetical protein